MKYILFSVAAVLLLVITIFFIQISYVGNFSMKEIVSDIEYERMEVGRLVDSTFTRKTNLDSLVTYKTIDSYGNVKTVRFGGALSLDRMHINKQDNSEYPIYEINNTNKVILSVYGEGQWDWIAAKVVVDKTTLELLEIQFDHKQETPGLGAVITTPEFRSQFVGSKLDLTGNSYSLQYSDSVLISGNYKIDGISGATITSKGAINMLNDGLKVYKEYLVED